MSAPVKPAISVVMPFRNAAGTVREAVESIRGQTFRDWELLAVDDGSTDGGGAVVRSMAAVDARIRLLESTGRGIVAALNHGLASGRGRWMARMDADDLALPARLERQAAVLEAHSEIGLVATAVEGFGASGEAAGMRRYLEWSNRLRSPEAIALARFVEAPVVHPSVCFRAGLVSQYGGYKEGDFPEDYELWLRWLDAGVRFSKLPEVLLRWRDRPERLTRADPRYRPEAFFACKAPWLAGWLRPRLAGGRRLLFWGAGRVTRRRVRPFITSGLSPDGYVDVDPRKIGGRIGGARVMGPEELPQPGAAFVVTCAAGHGVRENVERWLAGLGYRPGEDFIHAA
ncbi:MAG: glycosyltransferase [Puniceicoccaceae bacterium]|nr:MAG: glycosyltransferase [Puniceicoccaceae bacterium]